ncbi:MAG: MAPEG family protein [bacterium]|nr:MAPEG family protein [bacterium]
MTTELNMLALSALLSIVLGFPGVIALIMTKGLPFAAGNRDAPYELPDWGNRAKRAHMNMVENLPVFAALVLAAQVSGATNDTTALGATLFFWGRLAHAACYLAGIAWVRTGAFGVSLIGMVMIAGAIL